MLHYLVPLDPTSPGRFDPVLWSAYVRANMGFANKLVEVGGGVGQLAWWRWVQGWGGGDVVEGARG